MHEDHLRNSPSSVELAERAARAQRIISGLIGAFNLICEARAKYRQPDRKSGLICSLPPAAKPHPAQLPTLQQRLVSWIKERPDVKKESLRAEAILYFASEKITKRTFNAAFSEVKNYGRGRPRKSAW